MPLINCPLTGCSSNFDNKCQRRSEVTFIKEPHGGEFYCDNYIYDCKHENASNKKQYKICVDCEKILEVFKK